MRDNASMFFNLPAGAVTVLESMPRAFRHDGLLPPAPRTVRLLVRMQRQAHRDCAHSTRREPGTAGHASTQRETLPLNDPGR